MFCFRYVIVNTLHKGDKKDDDDDDDNDNNNISSNVPQYGTTYVDAECCAQLQNLIILRFPKLSIVATT